MEDRKNLKDKDKEDTSKETVVEATPVVAEAVVEAKGVTNLVNMIGYNFRLGEIECAIGIEQLNKLKGFVAGRQHAAERLTQNLQGLPGG